MSTTDTQTNTRAEREELEELEAVVVYHPAHDPNAVPARPAESIRILSPDPAPAAEEPPTVSLVKTDKTGTAAGTGVGNLAGDELDHGEADAANDGAVTGDGLVLVDAPAKEVKKSLRNRPRREVLPAWVRDPATAKSSAAWAANWYAHEVAFHAVRLPMYWWRLAVRSPIGFGRIVAKVGGWVVERDHKETRTTLFKGSDSHMYLKLKEDHRRQVRGRGAVVAGLVVMAAMVLLLVGQASLIGQLLFLATVSAGLGWVGRAEGVRITGRSIDAHEVPRLTADLIVKCLANLGLSTINAALREEGDRAIAFPKPITRDGNGWRADIDLPGGATAGEVIDKRSKLASGLRRPLGTVWPEADPDVHEGRLVLWVGDKPLSAAKATTWPLAKAGAKVNLFEAFPIGHDQRGRPVTITLMFVLMLIGAVPRQGKTFFLRLLLLASALDVRVELHVYDLKGGADLLPLKHVAHAFAVGDEDEDIDYLVRDLRALKVEMKRRYRLLRELPKDICPEGKVTDELASKKTLGLHPIVVAMDECGIAFTHPKHGKEITDLVVDLGKRGPAAGIIIIPATQRIDAASVPTGLSAIAVLRFALKVMDHTANDMILGTGMYKNGVRATMFAKSDKGIGLLVGEGDDPVIVRSAYVDSPAADTIALRARAARIAAGRLTGAAADEDLVADVAEETVLDHLLAVWPAETDQPGAPALAKVWCDELADRLGESYPAVYGGWVGEQVTSAVKPHNIGTVQVKRVVDGRTVNKRGLVRDQVQTAWDLDHTGDSTDGQEDGDEPTP